MNPVFDPNPASGPSGARCPRCGGGLMLRRRWRRTEWRCRACDAQFSLEELTEELDDAVEAALANIPCNRL